jgi:FixJ family two-component response regulator
VIKKLLGRGGEVRKTARRVVSVVDDDESVRESLPHLIASAGFEARAFASADEFLAADAAVSSDCLVLDVAMPGMSGPELRVELLRRGCRVPVVFITASHDEAMRTRLLRGGAVECIFKPFGDDALLDALTQAMSKSR